MRIIGLLLLVAGVITLAALLLGDAPPFISDYLNRGQLQIVAPGLLFLGAFVVLMTGEG